MDGTSAIAFAEEGEAARINYSIPMPGAHTGKRIVEISLDLEEAEAPWVGVFADAGMRAKAARSYAALWDRPDRVNEAYAAEFFASELARAGFEEDGKQLLEFLKSTGAEGPETKSVSKEKTVSGSPGPLIDNSSLADAPKVLSDYDRFVSGLRRGTVLLPRRTWAGKRRLVPMSGSFPTDPITDAGDWEAVFTPRPRLFLVERYGISSFLGDYGMGRTVKTFTLLPGESTKISLKTWMSTKDSIQESSSIVDSHEEKARERFSDKIQEETTDRATREETTEWHVEAEAEASWGFGSASVSGGGSGEYVSGREQFASQATEAVQEHAAEASSKRELSVTSSSERTEESGAESLIERTIENVNKRRVLNFVFRELNQSYITKLHLKEVRVAFTDCTPNSWREVPMSGLYPFLRKLLAPEQVDRAAQQILKAAGIVFDQADAAVMTLERVRIAPDGSGITVEPATLDASGEFPAPDDRTYYRFRQGPLNQEGDENPVKGVLLSQRAVTLRTDSVIVEALLGQADALDDYAMERQSAAAEAETLANRREELIHETLREIHDPVRRAELAAAIFGPQSEG